MNAKTTFITRAVRTALAACALVAATLPMSASAGIVFQSVANLTDASKIDTYGWCSSCDGGYRVFDQFTLAGAASITGFSVSLFADFGYWPSNVNLSVWSVGGNGFAGTQLFSQDFAAASLSTTLIAGALSPSVIASSADVAGLSLGAGSYFVSFYNAQKLAVNGYRGGANKLYQLDGSSTSSRNDSAGFTLSSNGNTVPEPTSLALIGLAMLCAGAVTRRRRG